MTDKERKQFAEEAREQTEGKIVSIHPYEPRPEMHPDAPKPQQLARMPRAPNFPVCPGAPVPDRKRPAQFARGPAESPGPKLDTIL